MIEPLALQPSGVGQTDTWSRWLALAALGVSIATFVYTVFIKPRRDLRHGSAAWRQQKHDEAVAEIRRLMHIDASTLQWALQQLALQSGIDPEGRTLTDRTAQATALAKELKQASLALMSDTLRHHVEQFARELESLRYPLEELSGGRPVEQWQRDMLSQSLNRDMPELAVKIGQGLNNPRPNRKPPLLAIRVETRRRALRRAAEETETGPMGC